EAVVLGSPRCRDLLIDFGLATADRISPVADGQVLPLGGKTLQFISAPWVHWPDTIFTYLKEDRVLFPCDFLGSHLASSDLYASQDAYQPAKRYYAEIMMPFRTSIQKHLARIDGLEVEIIAPSHGPLYDRPRLILDAYRDWSSDQVKNEVVLPYVSMHGSTEAMVQHLVSAMIDRGISVKPFDLTRTDLGSLAMALVDAATIVLGCSTVLTGPHPAVAHAAFLANALRPKARFASVIGSYGWGGKMVQDLAALIPNLKVELLDPVVIRGYPRPEDRRSLDRLADLILEKHRNIGIA
ncbi:MAG TPA: FprA family A-type flavoprotein, partial [Methanotrichaceae archaeon]|nr:FprA family A-type flavoprotein [Methanotrichaceae archaeon]